MGFLLGMLEAAALAAGCIACGWRLMHYFQLESYQLPGYIKSVKRNAQRTLIPCVGVAAVGALALVVGLPALLRILLVLAMSAAVFLSAKKEKLKKPFVLT